MSDLLTYPDDSATSGAFHCTAGSTTEPSPWLKNRLSYESHSGIPVSQTAPSSTAMTPTELDQSTAYLNRQERFSLSVDEVKNIIKRIQQRNFGYYSSLNERTLELQQQLQSQELRIWQLPHYQKLRSQQLYRFQEQKHQQSCEELTQSVATVAPAITSAHEFEIVFEEVNR
ncbi:hypothetical protein BJV82DRAFT_667330 [Fennellomyces sp. T-0311]|nr:hypothetical protein BJV82DRAFT_667330 [Fennellomyces sp. T-0311]